MHGLPDLLEMASCWSSSPCPHRLFCCLMRSLIKEFEQEARTDNMPAAELTSRKKTMVQQLNEYIAKKKELGNDIAGRKELIGAAKRGDGPKDYNSKPVYPLEHQKATSHCAGSCVICQLHLHANTHA